MAGLHEFWLGWRKDIVRGALIFAAVVGIGVVVTRASGRIPFDWANRFDWDNVNWNGDHDDNDRDWHESFRWSGRVAPAHWVWIRNTNGPVLVEEAEGDSFVVYADKRYRHSRPEDVEIRTIEKNGTVTVCALWRAEQAECGDAGVYRMRNMKKNDVAVRFRIQLPRGMKLDASTVNGPVEVEGGAAALALATVNGRINADADGPIKATTVNGSIHASIASFSSCADCEAVELKTVNGGITAMLPPNLNADLEASTVSGRVSTDLPIQLVGRVTPRQVRARIGQGGRRLALTTVNGSIEITQLEKDPAEHGSHARELKAKPAKN
jgi:hypothetical protein